MPYLPGKKKKFPATLPKQSLLQSPSPIMRIQQLKSGLWHRLLHMKLSSDHFKVSLLSPKAQMTQKADISKMLICSECVHSNSDVCCLKDLLNHRRYIFPLQTIKTTSNPEKDKTSPLVVMKVSRKHSFPLPLGCIHPKPKILSGLTPIGSHGGNWEVNSYFESPKAVS